MNHKYFIFMTWFLLLSGCTFDLTGDLTGKGSKKENEEEIKLQRVNSCPELTTYIKSIIKLEQENMGGYYRDFGGDAAVMTTGEQESSSDESMSATDYSTTNIQEEGVDEADFVKNDGSHIYVLNNGRLFIIDAWPPEDVVIISKTDLEGYATEMFVHNDKVLIFSSVDFDVVKERFNIPDDTSTGGDVETAQFMPSVIWRSITKVTILDITDKTTPRLERETYLEADYLDSRMINDTVHFVGNSHIYEPFYYNGCISYTDGGGEISLLSGDAESGFSPIISEEDTSISIEESCITQDEYLLLLEEKLAEIDYNDLLPKYYDIIYGDEGEVVSQDVICLCDNFYKPEAMNGKDLITILSFNLNSREFNSTAIIGQWGTVYASTDALYLASYNFDYWINELEDSETTEEYSSVHKFDISSDPDEAVYIASGKVPGQILNQFSMSEYNGFLRVATTENQNWQTGEDAKNNIFVLGQNGTSLDIAGSIMGLAPTERIYSARFMKEKGYVVTFRQVDPIFTIDLADPYNPQVIGELKVPGFSTYLHPMGDDHILAIGRDATDEGRVEGLKLSIFDVSDFANPSLLHEIIIGQEWGADSEASYNHKAFNYFAEKDLLAIPLSYYNWDDYLSEDQNFSGLVVFNVTTSDGIKELGRIDHQDLFTIDLEYKNCYYNAGVNRSIIMDDYVYSLSEWGIKANLLPDLNEVNELNYPDSDQQSFYFCSYAID